MTKQVKIYKYTDSAGDYFQVKATEIIKRLILSDIKEVFILTRRGQSFLKTYEEAIELANDYLTGKIYKSELVWQSEEVKV